MWKESDSFKKQKPNRLCLEERQVEKKKDKRADDYQINVISEVLNENQNIKKHINYKD